MNNYILNRNGLNNILRDRAEVARKAHNLEVGGSNPSPATKIIKLWQQYNKNQDVLELMTL